MHPPPSVVMPGAPHPAAPGAGYLYGSLLPSPLPAGVVQPIDFPPPGGLPMPPPPGALPHPPPGDAYASPPLWSPILPTALPAAAPTAAAAAAAGGAGAPAVPPPLASVRVVRRHAWRHVADAGAANPPGLRGRPRLDGTNGGAGRRR